MRQRLETQSQRLRDLARALPRRDEILDGPRQRLDLWADRLPNALTRGVERRRVALSEAAGSLRPSLLSRATSVERSRFADRASRLDPVVARLIAARREALNARAGRLNVQPLQRDVDMQRERLTRLQERLEKAQRVRLDDTARALEALDRLRETLGYRETLRRGYAVVRTEGRVVTQASEAKTAGALEIEFADGRMSIGGSAAPRRAAKGNPPEQGRLF